MEQPQPELSPPVTNRWLRITVIVVVVLLTLLAFAYTATRYAAGSLVQARIQSLRQAGYPVQAADLMPAPVPASRNAAPLYLQASGSLATVERQYESLGGIFGSGPGAQADLAAIHELLESNQPTFDLVRRASRLPDCQFDTDYRQGLDAQFPYYANMRTPVRALGYRALDQASHGDGPAAYDTLATSLRVARHLKNEPLLIGQLVHYACLAIVTRHLALVMDLTPPRPQDARKLWPLLDSSHLGPAYTRVIISERAFGITIWQQPPAQLLAAAISLLTPFNVGSDRQRFWMAPLATIGQPLLDANLLHYLDLLERAVKASRLPGQQARQELARIERAANQAPGYLVMARIMPPPLVWAREATDRAAANLALARWALALSLYRQRTGHYPARLAQAAAGMPSPPELDPTSGREPIYRPLPNSYLLYCLGPNGQDDGGSTPSARSPYADDIPWLVTTHSR